MISRRTTAFAAALSVLALGSPLIAGCGAQGNITEAVSNQTADLSSEDTLALKDEIADYTKATEINPDDADAYYNRGNAKQKSKDYQGAIADFNKAIEIDPQYALAYNNRGLAKSNLNDYQEAIADYNKAIEINSQYADAYSNRGVAKRNLGDYQGAIADYNKAIAINPQYGDAYNNRGVAKGMGFSDEKGACDDFKKAESLGNEYRINWLNSEVGAWCRNMR